VQQIGRTGPPSGAVLTPGEVCQIAVELIEAGRQTAQQSGELFPLGVQPGQEADGGVRTTSGVTHSGRTDHDGSLPIWFSITVIDIRSVS